MGDIGCKSTATIFPLGLFFNFRDKTWDQLPGAAQRSTTRSTPLKISNRLNWVNFLSKNHSYFQRSFFKNEMEESLLGCLSEISPKIFHMIWKSQNLTVKSTVSNSPFSELWSKTKKVTEWNGGSHSYISFEKPF